MKEYQEFLLRQLKEEKMAVENISLSHTVTADGRIGAYEISSISFAAPKDNYSIPRITIPELKEEILKQITKFLE